MVQVTQEIKLAINMTTSLAGMIELAGHEGICTSIYIDSVGVRTFGVGATREEIPDWADDRPGTLSEVFDVFKQSLKRYEKAVNNAITREITQQQFDALVSFCYNVGTGWFGAGGHAKATLVHMINRGEDAAAVAGAFMRFVKPPEIRGRRQKEANLFRTGKYQNGGKANLFPVSASGKPIYSKGREINVREYLGD